MPRRMIHIAVLLLVVSSVLSMGPSGAVAQGDSTLVANVTIMNSVTKLATDGRHLAWILYHSQGSPASMSSRVEGVDLVTGAPITIDLGWDDFDGGGAAWKPLIVDVEVNDGLLAVASSWNRY